MTTSHSTTSAALADPDLTDPLFAIEHLARLFLVAVDTAREYTYRADFPKPIKVGRRCLWVPDEVLAWIRKQPRFSVDQRKKTAAQVAPSVQAATPQMRYKPRKRRGAEVAA